MLMVAEVGIYVVESIELVKVKSSWIGLMADVFLGVRLSTAILLEIRSLVRVVLVGNKCGI